MNLALIDPFQLAQDSPDALTHDLRSGHATTIRFSRKGDYLASGRVDGKVVIWDMETMGVALKLHGHFRQIQSLSWSRCGRYLLTASQDCRANLWDLQTQERIRTVKFEAPIYTAELHPYNRNLFVASLFEDKPYLVDITDPIPRKLKLPTTPLLDGGFTKSELKQATTSAIFSTHGNHIITGTSKGYLNIVETETRKIIHSTKLCGGLISLLRLTTNGRQLLANSTDRIIRVVEMPDLSILRPSTAPHPPVDSTNHDDPSSPSADPEADMVDPATLPENLHLHTSHKFQDLVNRLRWNHCAFSHTSPATSSLSNPTNTSSHLATASASTTADYVAASTYMKKDIYIWELRTNSLLRILENREEPAIIEWHPSRPLLALTSIETGSILIWGIEPQQKWSALAPDFTELTENVEYIEREDEFDTYPQEEHRKRRADREDEEVDVLTGQPGRLMMDVHAAHPNGNGFEDDEDDEDNSMIWADDNSFILPMIYDINEHSDNENDNDNDNSAGGGREEEGILNTT